MSHHVEALVAVVGAAHVKADEETRQKYGRSSGFDAVIPPAVVFPSSTQEVSEILALAHKEKFCIYPISGGKNWGYGDASALSPDDFIMDLKRMNKIVEVNSEAAYAVIQAGVTQGQLAEYLEAKRLPLWMDSTGAGPDSSIVGNFADRGFGHTRYGDHFASCAGLEVVLGDGRILKTGFGHYAQARAAHVFRYGIGPSLDGLFSQSNFGVITEMSVCLMPETEDFCVFLVTAQKDEDIHGLISALAPLRRSGVLQSCVHVMNDVRIISGTMRYPWQEAQNRTPLSDTLRAELRSRLGVGAWSATGILTGSPKTVRALKLDVKHALKDYDVKFFSKRLVDVANILAKKMMRIPMMRSAANRLSLLRSVADMLRGKPGRAALPGALWRVRSAQVSEQVVDILDHHAGLAWISPALPALGKCTKEVLDLLKPIYAEFGFDFMGTFTLINERALVLVSNISFDPAIENDRKNAQLCYKRAMTQLVQKGYIPYRCAPRSAKFLLPGSSHYWDVVHALKMAIDPSGVVSPGRYDPKA